MHYTSLRPTLEEFYAKAVATFNTAFQLEDQNKLDAAIQRIATTHGVDYDTAIENLVLERVEFTNAHEIVKQAQTVIFDVYQAQVLWEAGNDYLEQLDFRLPYENLFIQFSRPFTVKNLDEQEEQVVGFLLNQSVMTQEAIAFSQEFAKNAIGMVVPAMREGDIHNTVIVVFGDYNLRKLTWITSTHEELFQKTETERLYNYWNSLRNLVVACVGYINCENIVLEKNSVDEKVNRKRTKSGKKVLESYYTCRIRKSKYSTNDYAKQTGYHHSFRYDVRGHFRRLVNGKTTWVRSHQRGLQHELYVPKTYTLTKS